MMASSVWREGVVLLRSIRFKKLRQMASASQPGTASVFPATIINHTPTYPSGPPAPTPDQQDCTAIPAPASTAACCTPQQLTTKTTSMPTPRTTACCSSLGKPSAGMGLQHRPQQVHPCARKALHLALALVHGERRLQQPRASTEQQQQGWWGYHQSITTRLWRPADPAARAAVATTADSCAHCACIAGGCWLPAATLTTPVMPWSFTTAVMSGLSMSILRNLTCGYF